MPDYVLTLENRHPKFDDRILDRFEAVFTPLDADNKKIVFADKNREGIPRYIAIGSHRFKSVIATRGMGTIFISPEVSGINRGETYKASSRFSFFWYKIKQSPVLRYQMVGILVLLLGTSIDSAFLIGQVKTVIEVGSPFAWLLASGFLKVMGVVFLIFSKFFASTG